MRKGHLSVLLFLAACAFSCGKDRDDNRYSMIGRHWVESARTVNGEGADPTQLQHIFFTSGYQGRLEYEYICGITGGDHDCLPGQHYRGSWQLLSDTTLSTELNGAIRVYFIEKLTTAELWLRFDSGNNKVISKMIRYR